ncbi:ABC transporter ATP-binding protein [Myxococcota bacterium]|nr:ABC transporter ATP-binding protein [Myxococcota bacterium]
MKITLRNVAVGFGPVQALRGVDLDLEPGRVTVLVGPNGAGKSTLMGVLLGLVRADRGTVEVDGASGSALPASARVHLGYLPEAVGFADNVSGRQVTRFFALARGLPRAEAEAALERVGLAAAGGRLVSGYSRGMRQRLGLGIATMGAPRLLVLDEPTGGLDQEGLGALWRLLGQARDRGCTILVTTHDLALIERRADQVVILRQGRVCARGTPRSLREQSALPLRVHVTMDGEAGRSRLADRLAPAGLPAERQGEDLVVRTPPQGLPAVMAALEGLHGQVRHLRVEEPGLDQVYEHLLAAPDGAPAGGGAP